MKTILCMIFYTLQPLTRTGIGAVTLIVEETKANLQ